MPNALQEALGGIPPQMNMKKRDAAVQTSHRRRPRGAEAVYFLGGRLGRISTRLIRALSP